MTIARYALAAFVLLGALPAQAQPQWTFPARTADFVAKCKRERAWCGATLKDMHLRDSIMSAIKTRYCVPHSLAPRARVRPVLAWLARHPHVAQEPARDALLAASKDLWPCPQARFIDPFPCGEAPKSQLKNSACDGGPAPVR